MTSSLRRRAPCRYSTPSRIQCQLLNTNNILFIGNMVGDVAINRQYLAGGGVPVKAPCLCAAGLYQRFAALGVEQNFPQTALDIEYIIRTDQLSRLANRLHQ